MSLVSFAARPLAVWLASAPPAASAVAPPPPVAPTEAPLPADPGRLPPAAPPETAPLALRVATWTPSPKVGEARDALALASVAPTRDPPRAHYDAEDDEIAAARRYLKAEARAIKAALVALDPAAQAAYGRVQAALVNPLGASDELGADQWEGAEKHFQAALARLLVSGALSGRDLGGKRALLERLDQLATQPLGPGLDRLQLLRELVVELHDPVRITQGSKGVCGAVTVANLLVRASPAEYAGLVADLARPEGAATLADGTPLARAAGIEHDHITTTPTRLLWPALMEVGNGPDYTYDFAADRSVPARPELPPRQGLDANQIAALATRALGRPYTARFAVEYGVRDAGVVEVLRAATARGDLVPASLPTADGRQHSVLVTGFDPERVHFVNPHGREESAAIAEFAATVFDYAVPGPR